MIDLRLGDCLDIMRGMDAESIDAVVTDPPYGIGKLNKFGSRRNLTRAMPYTPIYGDDKPFDPSWLLKFPIVVIFGANWFANKLPSSGGWFIWDKKDGGTPDNFSDAEMAWTNASNVVRIFHHKWRGMIKASERDQRRIHPMQKPIAVMKWIIKQVTREGDTILDPYMGSGTTGVACVQLNRNFIGCEIDPQYFEIAKRRIKADQPIAIELPFMAET